MQINDLDLGFFLYLDYQKCFLLKLCYWRSFVVQIYFPSFSGLLEVGGITKIYTGWKILLYVWCIVKCLYYLERNCQIQELYNKRFKHKLTISNDFYSIVTATINWKHHSWMKHFFSDTTLELCYGVTRRYSLCFLCSVSYSLCFLCSVSYHNTIFTEKKFYLQGFPPFLRSILRYFLKVDTFIVETFS